MSDYGEAIGVKPNRRLRSCGCAIGIFLIAVTILIVLLFLNGQIGS